MARVLAWYWPIVALAPLAAFAQQADDTGVNRRIAPPAAFTMPPRAIYSTHDTAGAVSGGRALPWLKQRPEQNPTPAASGLPSGEIPFRRAAPQAPHPVLGVPRAASAVPVDAIDGIEVSEPAAPMASVPGANPAEEDPTNPTALTAPLFSAALDTKTPRIIELRVLNKVTAQAETITLKPGEAVEFGRLEITALQCYPSTPESRPDAVALLSIREFVPERNQPKDLFYGWMYASSPSLTALEHPVYDVTMVACTMAAKAEANKATDKKE